MEQIYVLYLITQCYIVWNSLHSGYSKQFNLKNQGRAAGDAGLRELAVSHFRRDVHLPFVAHAHLLHGDNPSLNQVAQAEGYRRTAAAAVKLLAVDGPSRVVRGDDTPRCGMLAVILARCQHLVINTLRERHHSLFLCLFGQPVFVGLHVFFLSHDE